MPLWVTETVWPATVSVPTRCEVEGFAVALKVTVPLPDPLAPLLMVSQAALLAAVHVHPLAVVTAVVERLRGGGQCRRGRRDAIGAADAALGDIDRLAGDGQRAGALGRGGIRRRIERDGAVAVTTGAAADGEPRSAAGRGPRSSRWPWSRWSPTTRRPT